jgi:biopolymer transport protein ExbD
MLVATSDENGPLEKLHEMLEVSVAAWGKGQPGVMLKVADDVAQQRFVDVLDAFAACGIETVGFTD